MPKANLRPVSGTPPLKVFECSICKTKFFGEFDTRDLRTIANEKADLFKQWDSHLYLVHRRQWDFQQAKNLKRKTGQAQETRKSERSP
jgi:hypothetical protein